MPETSIIIRIKDEEKWIGQALKRLFEQSHKDFEVIIVDSGSTDKTPEIIKNFDVRLFQIKPGEFSYPFALNYGCKKALGEKYFVFISGHSLPCSNWEKIIFNKYICKLRSIFRKREVFKDRRMGIMGFTNAMIRRDLWDKRHFNEEYGLGGEDGEWAGYWFKKGFKAIRDIKFSVYHSHGLGLINLIKQLKYWSSLDKPQPFMIPDFRKKK